MLITPAGTYEEIYRAFSWKIPTFFNMAHAVCDRHAEADPAGVALLHDAAGGTRRWTFRDIQRAANRFANMAKHKGLQAGDRVAILLGQDPEAPITHVGAWKAGLVSVTMSRLFGPEALLHRLDNSGSRLLVTDMASYPNVEAVRDRLPFLDTVLLIDGEADGAANFWSVIERASDLFETMRTRADDPAFINYTSGTTGAPKGVLKAHKAIIGQMPGTEFCHDFFPQEGDLFWSPADWSWLAGMMNILLPAWFYGKPVLAFRASSFDPEQALAMMIKHNVRNTLLTPTMLKLLRQIPGLATRSRLPLRTIVSGSEAVGTELMNWTKQTLGLDIHVVFGQTECNSVIGNNGRVMTLKPGALGRPMPGHVCAIVNDAGEILPPGTIGNIAFRRPDPLMMVEYWNDPAATKAKFAQDWMLTGDLGQCDDEGYFWFHARADDVINSSGYRIGPGEVEDVLLKHPAVALAGVIGVPDAERQEIVKAFIMLSRGAEASDELREDIRSFVKARLAKHEAPREIEFVEELPLTATGKIMRRTLRQRESGSDSRPAAQSRPEK